MWEIVEAHGVNCVICSVVARSFIQAGIAQCSSEPGIRRRVRRARVPAMRENGQAQAGQNKLPVIPLVGGIEP